MTCGSGDTFKPPWASGSLSKIALYTRYWSVNAILPSATLDCHRRIRNIAASRFVRRRSCKSLWNVRFCQVFPESKVTTPRRHRVPRRTFTSF